MESNFITPPDLLEAEPNQHTVVLIDPSWEHVEEIALFCKDSKKTYNVYLYTSDMKDLTWLDRVSGLVNKLIINTVQTDISPIKDTLAEKSPMVVHYGPKSFFGSVLLNRIEKPLDYFKYFDSL